MNVSICVNLIMIWDSLHGSSFTCPSLLCIYRYNLCCSLEVHVPTSLSYLSWISSFGVSIIHLLSSWTYHLRGNIERCISFRRGQWITRDTRPLILIYAKGIGLVFVCGQKKRKREKEKKKTNEKKRKKKCPHVWEGCASVGAIGWDLFFERNFTWW